jgi:hypothetical protein
VVDVAAELVWDVADAELSELDVELSVEHADTPSTASAAMVAAVKVLR